jgi:hypothetical protein
MERGVNQPSPSSLHVVSPRPRGEGSLLVGPSISERQPKCLQAEGGSSSNLSGQPSLVWGAPDHEGERDPFICSGEREVGLPPLHDAQQVLESLATVATVSSSFFGESGSFTKKVHSKGCLPGMCSWNAVGLLCSLSLLVPELGICWVLNRKRTLGALSIRRSVARLEPPTPSSSDETTWVETSRGPNSSPSQKATIGDIPSAPGSSDATVLGPTGGGHGAGMLTGCDCVPAAMRNTNHSWQSCSATDLGQHKDGKQKSPLYLTFSSSSSFG